jgi:hypothetical protein
MHTSTSPSGVNDEEVKAISDIFVSSQVHVEMSL